MVASIVPSAGSADDVVTGSLPPGGLDGASGGGPDRLTIQVTARDSRGNISVMTFTLDLRPGKQSLNGFAPEWSARSAERAAPALEREGWFKPVALASSAVALPEHGDERAAPSGRAALAEHLGRHGWRAIDGQRMALLHNLRNYAAARQ